MKFGQGFNLQWFGLFLCLIITTGCVVVRVHTTPPPIQNPNQQCPSCPSPDHVQIPTTTHAPLQESKPEPTKIPLKIKKHTSVKLTEDEAIGILEHANQVANEQDQCNLQLIREGEGKIEEFTWPQEGDKVGVISSQFDFDVVTGLPGVKLVQDIQWCELPGPFMGCADLPGQSLAVVMSRNQTNDRPYFETLGVLWLHEVGHNKNNRHRLDSTAVMYPQIFPDHNELTPTECGRYQQP